MQEMEKEEKTLEQLCRLYVTYRQRYVITMSGGKIFTPKRRSGEYAKLTNNVLRKH